MKSLLFPAMLISTFMSCSKEPEPKTEVEIFMEQVKSDKYTADTLPEFSPDEIPVLLRDADDFSEIRYFPVNPLSSQGPNQLTVGECMMWTIEHIRLFYGYYTNLNQFPSLIPELKIRSLTYGSDLNETQLKEAYSLYYNWWYDNTVKDFEETRLINPLEVSPYVWR